jgi:hypothetical protein
MEFGLLPKISTPVQKPVEIRVLRRTNIKLRIGGTFLAHSNNPDEPAVGR